MQHLIDAPLALLGGVLTIASPCVLPILPIVLGGTLQESSRSRPLFIVAGFVLAFASLGLLLASASQQVAFAHETLRLAGIAMLALTGLAMLRKAPYAWLANRVSQFAGAILPAGGERAGKLGGFVLGMSLGAVWTPCAGPVLASILVLVAQAQDIGWSSTLLLLYAIGAGIPMLAIAYGGQFARQRIRALARYTGRLQQVFGVLILATSAAIYFQYDVLLVAHLANFISL
ncbi:cytochrome c biogenesis CcdA family protein [Massilia sp. ZL223]|uniref:cytochrome c biogenesis CcdA family protein n=1 Tax=Massilia sp. ZL223 TaxID=2824904 RepID=UPI001B8160CE|nr:cytochrome c biogenesis CcdA family protein [Massilia sp. ZL223]MBQ5964415.1 cytochrome c biogenesis protein CcdA [Massilia sp. ZL223]